MTVVAIRLLGLVMQTSTFVLIARTHSLSEVGVYAFISANVVIVRALGPLGYDQAALKYLSSFLQLEKNETAKQFFSTFEKKILFFAIFISFVPFLFGFILLYSGGNFSQYGIALILLAAMLPAYAIMGFYVCSLRANEKIIIAQTPESMLLQTILLLLLIVLLSFDVASIETTLIAQVIAAWLVTLFYKTTISKLYRNFTESSQPLFDSNLVKEMAVTSLKAMAATALAARGPVLLLPFIVSTELVGLFEGALRIALLGTIPVWAIGIVVSPLIARAGSADNISEIQRLYLQAALLQTAPAVAVLLVLIFCGDVILVFLLGAQFEAVYHVCVIVALATTVNAAGSVASNYLLMTNGEKTVQYFSVLALLVVIIGVPLGAFTGGLLGAAWAIVCRSVVRDFGLTIYVLYSRKLFRSPPASG